ncbi:DUF262 domain-containing protein [Acidovorax delafieldii]|uniref:DUF262 domain-containing protein n=1 Tax=Acidovorax delafieldii TaxID=47920 RepID=UPI003ECD1830
MRLLPSDPDIETIVGRIKDSSLDLQPNFQRGEVWSVSKKQRLIDSILRDWHVPPIHVVVDKSNRHLVLDGQQRLVSIRDFVEDMFPIDGKIQPIDNDVEKLNGLRFSDLSDEWKRKFNQFTLRLFRITDYDPSEPGELFFRLNQPSALTSAEQRNSFFGNTREQIKELVQLMDREGLDSKFWGFSNARMAYDDIIARTCLVLEQKTLKKKVTALALSDRYRSGKEFSPEVEHLVRSAIQLLGQARSQIGSELNPFNKATSQSWLVFIATLVRTSLNDIHKVKVAPFLSSFSRMRDELSLGLLVNYEFEKLDEAFGASAGELLLHVYEDRSTSRVADVSSVTLRDFVLWMFYWTAASDKETCPALDSIRITALKKNVRLQSIGDIETLAAQLNWGELF